MVVTKKPVRYVLVSKEDNETIIDTFVHTGEFPMEVMFPPGLRWVPCPHKKVVHGWKYVQGRFVPPPPPPPPPEQNQGEEVNASGE